MGLVPRFASDPLTKGGIRELEDPTFQIPNQVKQAIRRVPSCGVGVSSCRYIDQLSSLFRIFVLDESLPL